MSLVSKHIVHLDDDLVIEVQATEDGEVLIELGDRRVLLDPEFAGDLSEAIDRAIADAEELLEDDDEQVTYYNGLGETINVNVSNPTARAAASEQIRAFFARSI